MFSCLGFSYTIAKKLELFRQIYGTSTLGAVTATALIGLKVYREKQMAKTLKSILSTKHHQYTAKNLSISLGVNISRKFGKDLKSIYDKYLSNLLLSDEKFLGPTISSIKNFKETIGISDEDASLVHIAVGKRINHTRSESENRNEVVDAGRTFNKIIYITTQVFGERKSYYLVDWKRHFNLTNAQIFIAKRDFASKIFKTTLLSRIDDPLPGETFFSSARQEMGKILLTKEVAGKITNDTMEKISAVKIFQAGEEIKKILVM
jgi:hypothetical protein